MLSVDTTLRLRWRRLRRRVLEEVAHAERLGDRGVLARRHSLCPQGGQRVTHRDDHEQQHGAEREHPDERPQLARGLQRSVVGGVYELRLDPVAGVDSLGLLHPVELPGHPVTDHLGRAHSRLGARADPGDLHDRCCIAELVAGLHLVAIVRSSLRQRLSRRLAGRGACEHLNDHGLVGEAGVRVVCFDPAEFRPTGDFLVGRRIRRIDQDVAGRRLVHRLLREVCEGRADQREADDREGHDPVSPDLSTDHQQIHSSAFLVVVVGEHRVSRPSSCHRAPTPRRHGTAER
jgi:hypothetical protein